MLGALGALGSFGGGFGEGVTSMFELQEKLRKRQEDEAAFKAATLGGVGGLGADYTSPLGTGGQQAPQTAPGGSAAPGGAGPTPGNDPSTMVGGYPALPSQQFQPVGNIANASMQANQPNPSALGAQRQRIFAELQNDPQTARQFDAMVTAEAGQDPMKRQIVGETMINSALSSNQPLKAILSRQNFYPPETFARAAQGGSGQPMTEATWDPVNPANVAGYGTGNASMDPRTGRQVGYAGGPQTAFAGGYRTGEGAGIEGGTMPWARSVGYQGPGGATARGPGGPQPQMEPSSPVLAQLRQQQSDIGKIGPQDFAQSREKGYGPLTIGQAARRIDQVMPNASPGVKFGAMQKLLKLVNEQEQQQFNRFLKEHTLHQQDLQERHRQASEDVRIAGEQRRQDQFQLTQMKNDPRYGGIRKNTTELMNRSANVGVLEETMTKHLDKLIELSKPLNLTQYRTLRDWAAYARSKFSDPAVTAYNAQAETLRSELGRLLHSPTGNAALSVNTQKEMEKVINGVATPAELETLKKTFQYDAKTKADAYKKQLDTWNKQYQQLEEQYGIKGRNLEPLTGIADDPVLSGTGDDAAAPAGAAPAAAAPAAGGGGGLPPGWSVKIK
jgi:hypothetical protein